MVMIDLSKDLIVTYSLTRKSLRIVICKVLQFTPELGELIL